MRVIGMAVNLLFCLVTMLTSMSITSFAQAGDLAGVVNFADDFKRAAAQGKTVHVVDIDNDSLLLKKDDGFYTSSARYSQQYTLSEAGAKTTFGWRIGHEMYTASDIKLAPEKISPQDHPYAAWLYGGWFKERQEMDGRMYKFGLDIGCIGPCAGGEWVQTNLHRLIGQPTPQAWSTQVKNGIGVVLYGEVAPIRWAPYSWLDITPNLQARFGTIFDDASAGLTVRSGKLTPFSDQATLHAFLRVDARAVAYNATLQGAYFASESSPRTVQPKRLVEEAELGMLWQRAPFGIKASIVRRSSEIRDLSNAIGAQNFARLQFSYTP